MVLFLSGTYFDSGKVRDRKREKENREIERALVLVGQSTSSRVVSCRVESCLCKESKYVPEEISRVPIAGRHSPSLASKAHDLACAHWANKTNKTPNQYSVQMEGQRRKIK